MRLICGACDLVYYTTSSTNMAIASIPTSISTTNVVYAINTVYIVDAAK